MQRETTVSAKAPFAVRVIARSVLTRTWGAYARARAAGIDPIVLAHVPLVGVARGREIEPGKALLLLDMYNWIDDHVEEDMEDNGLTHAAATRGVLDLLHRDLVEVADYFNRLAFPLVVYRGMLVAPGTVVRAQGMSWTPNRVIAEAFATGSHDASEVTHAGLGGRGRSVLLTATVPSPAYVNWRDTFSLFHGYSLGVLGDDRQAEEEIRLSRFVHDAHAIPLESA